MNAATSLPTVGFSSRRSRTPALGLIVGVLSLMVLCLIGFPMLSIVREALVINGKLDLSVFSRALSDPDVLAAIRNTVVMVFLSGTIAVFVGGALAWFNERTNARLAWTSTYLPLIPLLVPSLASVIGWVMLAAPQAGLLNVMLRAALGEAGVELVNGPLNIYSWPGLIFVLVLYFVPYAFLLISAALQNLDPRLEEASRVHGAGPFRTAISVTLPAVGPSIGAAAVLMVITGFAIFSVPIVIGTGAHIDTLAVRIYRLLFTYGDINGTGMAIALSLFLLTIVQTALLLQLAISGKGQHAVIGGKGSFGSPNDIGPWRWPVRAIVVLYVCLSTVLPILGLLLVSLQGFWSPHIAWERLGFFNYRSILFSNSQAGVALANTLFLAASTATVVVLIAALFATYYAQTSKRLRRISELVMTFPGAIPHTVLAVGFIIVFSRGVLNLQGNLLLLGLAYFVISLPQGQRAASAAYDQVGPELSEASRICGASLLRTFRRIVLPLMTPSLVVGWVIVFVQVAGELTASAMLSGTTNPVAGFVLLNLWENGSFPQVAALALVITAIDFVVVLGVLRTARNRSDRTGKKTNSVATPVAGQPAVGSKA